jgi:D-xylulose reductase
LKFLKFLLIIIESGCGPLGLLVMAVAKAYGAKKIIAFDIEQSRVEFAVKYNADIGVVCPFNTEKVAPLTFATDFMNKIIAEHGLGSGVDLTIEATGAEACVQMAVVLTKSGGTCECSIMTSGVNHDLTFLSYTSWTGKVADFGSAFPLHGKGADYER